MYLSIPAAIIKNKRPKDLLFNYDKDEFTVGIQTLMNVTTLPNVADVQVFGIDYPSRKSI